MSAHAETKHGPDTAQHDESAIESLTEGISKVIDSVRIAVGKVFTGLGSLFKKILGLDEHGKAGSHGKASTHAKTSHPSDHEGGH